MPKRVRYREAVHGGGFTLEDYYTATSQEVIEMETFLLKETRQDLYIPDSMVDLKGKYELRKGPRIKDLYYEITQ